MTDQLTGINLVAGSRQPIPHPRIAGILVRLRARLNGAGLDRALSAGTDPASSAALAQRSAWLTSRRSRRRLARGLRRVLDPAEARRGPSAAVPPNRTGVEAARVPLTWVAAMLESQEPVYSQGVARVHLLLTSGGSALYDPRSRGQLAHEAEDILDAMEGREETW